MKFILGKKLNMAQLFQANGQVVPVTVIAAGPCKITQAKQEATDGYVAVQIGFGAKKKLTKPLRGHLKNLPNFRYLKEFRINDAEKLQKGQTISVEVFQEGNTVRVTSVSKGKGFQGVVKRHGFHGSPASHGHKDQLRMPGSIGATYPQRVIKGKRMAGRMGGEQVTVKNLKIVKIDPEKNYLYIKGAVPGARNGLVLISGEGELKLSEEKKEEVQAVKQDNVENVKAEPDEQTQVNN